MIQFTVRLQRKRWLIFRFNLIFFFLEIVGLISWSALSFVTWQSADRWIFMQSEMIWTKKYGRWSSDGIWSEIWVLIGRWIISWSLDFFLKFLYFVFIKFNSIDFDVNAQTADGYLNLSRAGAPYLSLKVVHLRGAWPT